MDTAVVADRLLRRPDQPCVLRPRGNGGGTRSVCGHENTDLIENDIGRRNETSLRPPAPTILPVRIQNDLVETEFVRDCAQKIAPDDFCVIADWCPRAVVRRFDRPIGNTLAVQVLPYLFLRLGELGVCRLQILNS
jgi:hypothetical protein